MSDRETPSGRENGWLHWHLWRDAELLVCSRRGHVLPAGHVSRLRPEDAGLGVDIVGGRRFARCLRCDSWREVAVPVAHASSEFLPPLEQISMPRRGAELREALVIRLIAIDRIFHVIIFGSLFVAALTLRLNIGPLRDQARAILDAVRTAASNSTQAGTQTTVLDWLQRLLNVKSATLTVLMITAAVYVVLEGAEAFGLWRERRWAEYLTAIATAGFLPFEIIELAKRITVIRVGALVVNLLILGWLVWRKKLFGVGGGVAALGHERPDPRVLLAPPGPAR